MNSSPGCRTQYCRTRGATRRIVLGVIWRSASTSESSCIYNGPEHHSLTRGFERYPGIWVGIHAVCQPCRIGGLHVSEFLSSDSCCSSNRFTGLQGTVKRAGEMKGQFVIHCPERSNKSPTTALSNQASRPALQPAERPTLTTDPARVEEEQRSVLPDVSLTTALNITCPQSAIRRQEQGLVRMPWVNVAMSDEVPEVDSPTIQQTFYGLECGWARAAILHMMPNTQFSHILRFRDCVAQHPVSCNLPCLNTGKPPR